MPAEVPTGKAGAVAKNIERGTGHHVTNQEAGSVLLPAFRSWDVRR
jgi:hypothetical protein